MSNNKLTVIDRGGTTHDLEWEPDQTLMEALRDNDLPVLASCGGTASCATCHVFLDKEVFDTLGERSERTGTARRSRGLPGVRLPPLLPARLQPGPQRSHSHPGT
jgi:ferredoxin